MTLELFTSVKEIKTNNEIKIPDNF